MLVEHLPKRTNLAQETAGTLKEWIAAGILKETLPGERELKARLGVGRNTLRLALDTLAQEGWVSTASHGQPRRVQQPGPLAPTEGSGASQLPVTFLSPYSPLESEVVVELEDLRMRLEAQGRRLQFIAPAVFRQKHPERHLERLVRAHPSAAWVLHVVSEPMQRWFDQQGIRAFLFGSPFPGVNLPFLVPDWEAAAFHAGVQLVRQGHRVIGILEYKERFPGVLCVERGLEKAIATSRGAGRLLVFKDELTPVSVARSLEAAFCVRERPTALVCTRSNQLLTCVSWLGSRGIRYPAGVSLVSLTSDTWFENFHPAVSHYTTNPSIVARDLAERVLELVEMGRVARKSLHLPLKYVPGASIGRAPGRG
jgi:DNA-binding LacI/PurR family transcriptional regulator